MATVTKLHAAPTTSPKATKGLSKAHKARIARQRQVAMGMGLVAATLTGLSLSHLAKGVAIVTHSDTWEGWAMAVGIDLGFIAMELGQIVINDKLRERVACYAKPAILGTLAGSAVMNAFAFASDTTSLLGQGAAVVFGCAVPALIYALTRYGATLYIDATK